jgi:hypothetical protein
MVWWIEVGSTCTVAAWSEAAEAVPRATVAVSMSKTDQRACVVIFIIDAGGFRF